MMSVEEIALCAIYDIIASDDITVYTVDDGVINRCPARDLPLAFVNHFK